MPLNDKEIKQLRKMISSRGLDMFSKYKGIDIGNALEKISKESDESIRSMISIYNSERLNRLQSIKSKIEEEITELSGN